MHGEDELVWVLQLAACCTRGHNHAQLLSTASSIASHALGRAGG